MKSFIGKYLQRFMRQPNGNKLSAPSSRWSREFHQSLAQRAVKPYVLADIGEGITECQIISWFVKPGDRVEQFDRICEVQSDKASVEVGQNFMTTAFGWDGRIENLRYAVDDMAIVGQPLLDIDTDEIEDENLKELEGNKVAKEDIIANEIQDRAGSESQPPLNTQAALLEARQPFVPWAQDAGPSLLIPSVRHMLKALNINSNEIQGTGRNGRITKEDVQRYQSAKTSSLRSSPSSLAKPPALAPSPIAVAEDRLVPLTPTMNKMFKTMTHSLTIPHFLYTHSVDITSINTLRKRLNTSPISSNGPELTVLPFILKALSHAFTQTPNLNAYLDIDTNPNTPQLLLKGRHNFGIAVDTPQGLLVPVVKDVQAHSVSSLAREIQRLSALAKDGKLGVDDFRGATFTVSNIGSIGGGVVSPIIVAPQVGIVGIGRMQGVPRFEKDEKTGQEVLIKKEEVVLSWSADHRALDGATVATCAEAVSRLVRDWGALGVLLK